MNSKEEKLVKIIMLSKVKAAGYSLLGIVNTFFSLSMFTGIMLNPFFGMLNVVQCSIVYEL